MITGISYRPRGRVAHAAWGAFLTFVLLLFNLFGLLRSMTAAGLLALWNADPIALVLRVLPSVLTLLLFVALCARSVPLLHVTMLLLFLLACVDFWMGREQMLAESYPRLRICTGIGSAVLLWLLPSLQALAILSGKQAAGGFICKTWWLPFAGCVASYAVSFFLAEGMDDPGRMLPIQLIFSLPLVLRTLCLGLWLFSMFPKAMKNEELPTPSKIVDRASTPQKRCKSCSAAIDADALYCPFCGTAVRKGGSNDPLVPVIGVEPAPASWWFRHRSYLIFNGILIMIVLFLLTGRKCR